jgi:hypothetical protein
VSSCQWCCGVLVRFGPALAPRHACSDVAYSALGVGVNVCRGDCWTRWWDLAASEGPTLCCPPLKHQ